MSTTKSTSRVFKVSTSVTEQLEMNKQPGQGRKIHGPYIHKTIKETKKPEGASEIIDSDGGSLLRNS